MKPLSPPPSSPPSSPITDPPRHPDPEAPLPQGVKRIDEPTETLDTIAPPSPSSSKPSSAPQPSAGIKRRRSTPSSSSQPPPIPPANSSPFSLDPVYQELPQSNCINESPHDFALAASTTPVNMDQFKVGHQTLQTLGVSSCIAVAALGQNLTGQPIHGLAHFSCFSLTDASTTKKELNKLHNAMRKEGCIGRAKLYLLGGNDESYPEANLLLACHASHNIVGAKLILSSAMLENSINVQLNNGLIEYYKSKP